MPGNFPGTDHCRNGFNCFQCRTDPEFQSTTLAIAFGGVPTRDECPRGLALGAAETEMPEAWQGDRRQRLAIPPEDAPPAAVCQYMLDLGRPVPDRPCYGGYIRCLHPDSPIRGDDVTWKSKCRRDSCRFFKA
jgi:hypothetical protein